MAIGKITRVPLREVWKHEAHDFTVWLANNIDVINDATNLSLDSVDKEQPAGSFSVDLVAENSDGGTVIIENQLERSDHDHLGKLLTYLTAYDAAVAVWIVSEARPEHTATISWLNKSTDVDFYLLQAEAIKIENSQPALLLTRILGPSAEIKAVGKDKKEKSEREHLREEFYSNLLESAVGKSTRHSNVSASKRPWLSASSGTRGINFMYGTKQHESSVFLYIDRGLDSEYENLSIFQDLQRQRENIEEAIGADLEWNQMDGKRACVISTKEFDGGYKDPIEEWKTVQDNLINTMVKFDNCLSPLIQSAVEYARKNALNNNVED